MLRSHFPDVRLFKEVESLSNAKYNIILIVWDRGKFNLFDTSILNFNKRIVIRKFKFHVPQDSLWLIIGLPFWWMYIWYQLLIHKADFIHAADFDTYFPAVILTIIKKRRIFYDIYDFYADMMAFPIFPTIFRKIIGFFDRLLMKFADEIILPDESRIEQINFDFQKMPIIIVNSPSIKLYIEECISTKKNPNLRVFFGGGVSENRGIDDMCKAVIQLDGVELRIVGPCSENFQEKLKRLCKGYEDRIKLELSWTSYDKIICNTINSDVTFALYNSDNYNQKYSSPNKLFEAMLCQKPIIVTSGTSMSEIVDKEKCGLIVDYGDIDGIKKTIRRLKEDSVLSERLGKNGKTAFDIKYSWEIMEKKLIELYAQY